MRKFQFLDVGIKHPKGENPHSRVGTENTINMQESSAGIEAGSTKAKGRIETTAPT